jgi:glyoxylase-like metal-dependent hydrolase (beta-lactamase superfamily II)
MEAKAMNISVQRKGIHRITLPTPFPIGPVNVYLVEGDSLTLVDAGPKTEEAWESLKRQLRDRGYSPSDIEQVVLTHHHIDHVGLLDFLREAGEIRIIGHPRNRPWIRQDEAFYQNWYRYMEFLFRREGVEEAYIEPNIQLHRLLQEFNCQTDLDREIVDGEEIPGMPGWRVQETKGHAQSHIALYREADGLMIGGDHLIAHVSSNALIEPPDPGERKRARPLLQYRKSLKDCLGMELSRVLAGHGRAITDAHSLIEERLNQQEKRALALRDILADGGPMTCFDLCKKLFPSKYLEQLPLTMSETLGHLDLLEAWGTVDKEEKGGLCYYRLRK